MISGKGGTIDTTRYRAQFNKLAKEEGIEWVQDDINPGRVDSGELKIDTDKLNPLLKKETPVRDGTVTYITQLLSDKIAELRTALETKRMEQVAKALGPQYQLPKVTVFDVARLSEASRQALPHFARISRLTDELHMLWLDPDMLRYEEEIKQQADKGDTLSPQMLERGSTLGCGRFEPKEGEVECELLADYPTLDKNSLVWPEGFGEGDLKKLAARRDSTDKSMLMSPYTVVEQEADGTYRAVPYTDQPVLRARLLEVATEFETIARIPDISQSLRLTATAYAQAIRNEKPTAENGFNPFAKAEYVWATHFDGDLSFTWGPFEEMDPLGIKRSFQFVLYAPRRKSMDGIRKNLQVLQAVENSIAEHIPGYQARSMKVDSVLHVSDVIMRAGDMHPQEGEYLAHVLPNDGPLVDQGRTRREIFANFHDGKGELILLPLADILLDPEQRSLVSIENFVETSANHELCHTTGPRPEHEVVTPEDKRIRADVATGSSKYAYLEESKADLGGLHVYLQMYRKGMIPKEALAQAYVTDVISKIRQTRFGKKSPHGKGAKAQLGYFFKVGAIRIVQREVEGRSEDRLRVDVEKMPQVIEDLLMIVTGVQQQGNAKGADDFFAYSDHIPDAQFGENGTFIQRINKATPPIPVDITLKARFINLENWKGTAKPKKPGNANQ